MSRSTITKTEDVGGHTVGSPQGIQRWRAHPDVAWVEGEGRVAILDLRDPMVANPMLCPEPVATLWRAVAQEPTGSDVLLQLAVDEVGEDPAGGLLQAFLDGFAERGLIEVVE